jgi:hypothetical protein
MFKTVIFTDVQNKKIYITSQDNPSSSKLIQLQFRPDFLYLNEKQSVLFGVEDNGDSKTVKNFLSLDEFINFYFYLFVLSSIPKGYD